MSNFQEFSKLNDLQNEIRIAVKTEFFSSIIDKTLESHVSLSGDINTGEKISKETEENVVIIGNNLGDVEVSQSSHEETLLGEVRLSSLERTGDDQHGLNGSQTPIVMGSLGEQISTEEIESRELDSQCLSLNETLSHEHVLANELKIGNDDSNGSEESLKTFGELRTTEITRVHGDVRTASGIKTDLITLEDESLLLLNNSVKDTFELDGAN
jgi:hypothetical protein